MKKLAYIALPISTTALGATRGRALEAKEYLKSLGYDVKTPFDLVPDKITDSISDKETKFLDIKSDKVRKELELQINILWARALGICLEYVVTCDIVYLLDGWARSKGATIEGLTAEMYKIPCYFEGNKKDIAIKDLLTNKKLGHVVTKIN